MPVDVKTAKAIFMTALEKSDPSERAAYVGEACGNDDALRQRVEILLKAHDDPASFMESPAAGPAASAIATVDEPITERPGTLIGPYKLIEQIGEGGMGSVWMAQQTQPVKRLVAVKLIKAGMDSRQVIARFEAERQALALMDHPNIARVLDAGTTKGEPGGVSPGRPYFVMDLVKGVPITRYCDEHHLTPRQRLELFIPVCQAIQHAHQKGIIHRDLKPSNVLVAPYDGKPVVKVIDFGVAKAAGQQLTDRTLVTGFGALVGTLEYMSPEQAELNNHDIDTRSDIYALGVLLYELLAGSTPFSRKELTQAGMLEMLRVIREQEPSKPSTKLSTAEGLPTLAANRGTEPAKLTKLVRGELDWIVMKALEKDRRRRYETANGFAIDVQRYLADEPVLACPPSAGYRLRKLVRRHRGPVLAAGVVLMTLLIGIAGTTWGLLRAEQQWQLAEAKKREAVQERDAKDAALKAEQQARADETKARQQAFAALRSMTANVVEQKFAQSTVLTEDDRAFLRGIIAQFDAFAAIKGDDAESRAARAEGRYRVAKMHHRLGELKEAEQDYDQALSIQTQLAADFPAHPELRANVASSHNNRGGVLVSMGRFKEAEQGYDQAISTYERLAADFPSRPEFRQELGGSYLSRSLLLSVLGRLKEAEKDFDQVLSIQKQVVADFPSRPTFRQVLAKGHLGRGGSLEATGRLKEARQDYDQALRIYKQLAADFPSEPQFRWELALSHIRRGGLLEATGRHDEAMPDYDQAFSIDKQLAAEYPSRPDFRQSLARGHYSRGVLLSVTGRLKEAEQNYGQALSIQKQLVADFPSQPDFGRDLARSHSSRGILLQNMSRFREAEQDYDQALSIQKQLAAGFPGELEFRADVARSHLNRGGLLVIMGRLKEAERGYDQALSIFRRLAADFPNQPDRQNELAGSYLNLADLHRRQGKWAAAKALLLEGRPHHLAALKANPRNPTYRQFYRKHLSEWTKVYAGLLEQEDAVRTAETCRDLGWNAPADAYAAACFLTRCIPIVAKHDKLVDKQRKAAAQFYGDTAMKQLRGAVSKGWKNVPHMQKDSDLDPLRQREDFKKLIVELEGKRKQSKVTLPD